MIIAVAFTFAASGCNKPTAELEKAKNAIADAKRNAGDCAAADIKHAESYLEEGINKMNSWKFEKAMANFQEAYLIAEKAKDKPCPVAKPGDPVYVPKGDDTIRSHTVVKGDCLWWIAEDSSIYADPFQWPIIYDANRDDIDSTAHRYGHYTREEDWIYPDQVFDVPRGVSIDKISNARSRAGAPDAYGK
jgi:nucleoid-associated protein YgaU